MFGAKKKEIGGVEDMVIGSTIERVGREVVKKEYATTQGLVIVKNGLVSHPDGKTTAE